MPVIIKQPETDKEFEKYFEMRWRILRAPWNEPKGSETDDIEDSCFHVMATEDDQLVGIGRLQFNSDNEAQIRYMAVEPDYENRGIGRKIIQALEVEALKNNCSYIMLDAREPAVGFYEKLGYVVTDKSYLLFGSIQHYRMEKAIKN